MARAEHLRAPSAPRAALAAAVLLLAVAVALPHAAAYTVHVSSHARTQLAEVSGGLSGAPCVLQPSACCPRLRPANQLTSLAINARP